MNALPQATDEVVETATAHWRHIASLLTPPRTEAEYHKLVERLDAVLDAGGADENHELATLADRMGELVAAYEDANDIEPLPANPIAVLEFLMERAASGRLAGNRQAERRVRWPPPPRACRRTWR